MTWRTCTRNNNIFAKLDKQLPKVDNFFGQVVNKHVVVTTSVKRASNLVDTSWVAVVFSRCDRITFRFCCFHHVFRFAFFRCFIVCSFNLEYVLSF